MLPCDAGGVPLSSPAYDQDGFLPLTGTQTGTASTSYPYPMRDTARRYPDTAGYYLTSFSPNAETQFPYTASPVAAVIYPGFLQAGVGVDGSGYCTCYAHNYIVNSSNVDVGYYAGDDGQGHTILGDIKGGVNASASSVVNDATTVNAYFKWFYLNGGQPATPPVGDSGPPTPMYLMLHSRVHVDASVDYGTSKQSSGLTAAAFATDGFGDTVSQGTPPGAPTASGFQTMERPFLLQPILSSSGIATVALRGTTSTSVNNTLSFGAFGFAPYVNTYKTTNGPTSASASAYVTARTQAATPFQCHSTVDSANWGTSKPLFFSGTNCTVTGSLTLPPYFTVLHGQLSVNSLVVQEYDDRATTPLSTDPRIAYSMGMSQARVSLPTPFDATLYPEGYMLPLRLKVWSSQGGPFEVNLSAPVHLPQLTPYVVWTPDYTAAPVNYQIPQAVAPSGSVMGGSSTLRVRVAYPPTASGTLAELRLHYHADPDATRDIVFSNIPLRLATTQNQAQAPYAAWAALCQDPDPSLTLSPPCAYAEVPWNPSAGLRNGVYDLTSAVTVVGSDGVTRTWTSPPFSVDREDLLITSTAPINPAPLLWDPGANSGSPAPLALSAAFHAAYKATGTATVQVYASDQTLVRTLTKAVLTTDATADAGTPMTWDGRGEPVNGQPGPQQPRGVYLFRWTLTDSLGVTDSDKSTSLSVTQTESDLTGDYDPATDRNTTKDGCVLTDSATPRADASAANVQVYAGDTADMAAIPGFIPWTQTVAPTPLPALTTNAPGATPPVWDEITFPEVIQMEEVHLFCAQDGHAATDRGGRSLWALQKNQHGFHPLADNYDAMLLNTGMDRLAANWQKWAGYASRANGLPTSLLNLANRMTVDHLMHFDGRGGGEDYAVLEGGIMIPASDVSTFQRHQRLFYHLPAALPPSNYNWNTASGFYFLTTQFPPPYPGGPNPQPFSKLQLAVWEGCLTASATGSGYDTGNLTDGTVALGAKCAVGFTGLITISNNDYKVWATSFWKALTVGESGNGNVDTVVRAKDYANTQVSIIDPGSNGYSTCYIAGNNALTIKPAL